MKRYFAYFSRENSARSMLILLLLCGFYWLAQPFTLWSLDNVIRALSHTRQPDERIVIVDIDDHSLSQLTPIYGKWPWPRTVHAEYLEYIVKAGAKLVVYDMLFSEPDVFQPESDQHFSEVIGRANNVVLAAIELTPTPPFTGYPISNAPPQAGLIPPSSPQAYDTLLMLPKAIAPENWQLGSVNTLVDDDGVVRRYALYHWMGEWLWPKLATAAASALNRDFNSADEWLLNWPGTAVIPYQRINYVELLQWSEQAPETFALFKDKVVFVGATATGLNDLRHTNMHGAHPGTVIHAVALDNILHNNGYQPLGGWWLLACVGLILLICRPVWQRQSLVNQMLQNLLFSVMVLVASYGLCWLGGRYFQLLIPWLAISLATMGLMLTDLLSKAWGVYRNHLKTVDTFNRFMDPKVVRQLISQKKLEPERLTGRTDISVLFSDIRGFTTLSEQKSAEQVIELLNGYFAQQVALIFEHQGTFDKFIGDAIMAFWGAPVKNESHAVEAVRCGIAMIGALEQFKQSLGEEGDNFDIGIGIHSGPAVVGMLGSDKRYDYTAIGDTVNVASRIEGQTKNRARLLISEATKAQCGANFDYIDHGEFHLKGRHQAVRLYEPRLLSQLNEC